MTNKVDSPRSKVDDLTPEQRRALLDRLLREKALRRAEQAPPSLSAHQLFAERAHQQPELTAIAADGIDITYRDLNDRANRLANFLKEQGLDPGSLIGVGVSEAVDLIVCVLAVLKAGCVCLPIDPRLPRDWTDRLLREAQPDLLLMDDLSVGPFADLRTLSIDRDRNAIFSRSAAELPDGASGTSLAFVVSARGRAVAIEHLAVRSELRCLQGKYELSPSDRVLLSTTPDHEDLIWQVLWPLVNGAAIVVPSSAALLQTIVEKRVTVLQVSPGRLRDLISAIGEKSGTQVSSVRAVICSGGILPRDLAEDFRRCFATELHYCYSLAETTGPVTAQTWKNDLDGGTVTIGQPLSGSVYILDQGMQLVPLGVTGEIYVGSDALARGYWRDEERTARQFVANPFTVGSRLFRTGNLGRRTGDGRIELVMTPSGSAWIEGCRVETSVIEAALLEDSSVGECVVLIRDEYQATPSKIAYIVPSGAAGVFSPERLRASLEGRLPQRFLPDVMLPITVLPLTTAGEIDEGALLALELVDQKLAGEWEEALKAKAGVGQAVVVVQAAVERHRPLHLSDLLPASRKQTSTETSMVAPSQPGESSGVETSVDAWSDGGKLVISPNAPLTMTRALIETADRVPTKGIEFVGEDGRAEFQSYSVLLEEARRVLAGLRAAGLSAGDRAILQIRSLRDHFSVFWGCALGGITPVTVAVASSYDATNAVANKLHNVWELLGRPPILASEGLRPQLEGLRSALNMSSLEILPVAELMSYAPATEILESKPEDVLFLQLSSGSTGIPKCIQITHRGVVAHIHGAQQFNSYEAEDVSLNWLPMDHVVPILTCHLKDVYLGCQQIAVSSNFVLSDATRWLDLIERHRVTHTWSPNFGFKLVADAVGRVPNRTWDLSSIERFMNAGEQVTLPVVRDFLRLTAPFGVNPNAMQPAFGMAEACTCMTYQRDFGGADGSFRVRKSSLGGQLREAGPEDAEAVDFIGLGGPVPGVQIRIADKSNAVLPEGVIGRLQIKGDVVTPGYLNNDEANREAFVGDDWFNSGDLGFIRNGALTLTGREKEIIIVNGANFYCYEIEDVVNQIEGVEPTFSAACGLSDPLTGTEGLAIFFSPGVDDFEENVELIKKIRAKVTSSLGISPASVVPISRQNFPKTTSGKIQRTKLKKQLEDGDFDEVLKEIDIHLENSKTIPDWFFAPIWRRSNRLVEGVNSPGRIELIFVDQTGLGTEFAVASERVGARSVCVEPASHFAKLDRYHYHVNPAGVEDYNALFSSLSEDGLLPERIVHFWNYGPAGTATTDDLLNLGVYSLLRLCQGLARFRDSSRPIDLCIVSSDSQLVVAGDRIEPVRTSLIGLLKTIPQELPWIDATHIDLVMDRENVAILSQELSARSGETFIAYRGGERWIQRLERIDFARSKPKSSPLRAGGRYVITGGLGGVSLEIVRHLLEAYGARLLLIGRTALTDLPGEAMAEATNERLEALRSLRRFGGEVVYRDCDITDVSRLRMIVDRAADSWEGAIDGVFHLAGVFRERMLSDETKEEMAAVLRPKVHGTLALSEVLEQYPSAFLVSFSSVNAFFGGVGVGAYAAANSFLSGYALSQLQERAHRSYSLLWSMWDDLGMSREYGRKELSRARGYYAIPPAQGLSSCLIALHHKSGPMLVGLDSGRPQIRASVEARPQVALRLAGYFTIAKSDRRHVDVRELHDLEIKDRFGHRSSCDFIQVKEMPMTEAGEIDRERLERGDGRLMTRQRAMPRTDLEAQLARIWQSVLNIPQVGVHDNFFELGGHSLLAVRLLFRIREVLNLEFPVDKVIESPTIAGMARWIQESSSAEGLPGEMIQPTPNCLVPLQTKGDGKPFFCVHPAGGSPLCYVNLATNLGEHRPFLGFQSPGLYGECQPLTTVEEIAARYVGAMRVVQPRGPYLLGAWSSGGPVAFEMARVLESQGEKVGLLAMLDCGVMESDAGMSGRKSVGAASLLKGSLMLVRFGWQMGLPLSYRELRMLGQFAGISLPPRLRDVFRRSPGSRFGSVGTLMKEIARSIEIFKLNSVAGLEYHPREYAGRVTLFRADEHRRQEIDPVIRDLEKYAAGGVDVHRVSGNHMSIILDKKGSILLAEKLRECLDQK